MSDELRKYKRQISQKEAIERLTETDDGKLLIEYLSDLVLFDIGTFCNDPYALSFREGRRSILINLLSLKDMKLMKYIKEVKRVQVNLFNEEQQ
jgi:hypothetical protein